MMAFTISVLSVLVSVSGAGGRKTHVHKCLHPISVHIRLKASLLTFAFHLQLLVELKGLFFSAKKIIKNTAA